MEAIELSPQQLNTVNANLEISALTTHINTEIQRIENQYHIDFLSANSDNKKVALVFLNRP